MVEKHQLSDLEILRFVQNKLLATKLPYVSPNLTIDAALPAKEGSVFVDIIHPAPNLIDFIIGRVQGPEHPALILAMIMRMDIFRLAKPFLKGHYFDKMHLWEKNILSPAEILKRINQDFGGILYELGFMVALFYGRINLEYHTCTYIDCGSNKPLHYRLNKNKFTILRHANPPLGTQSKFDFHTKQISLESDDTLLFYLKGFKEKDEEPFTSSSQELIPFVENQTEADPSHLIIEIKKALGDEWIKDEKALLFVLKLNQERKTISSKGATAKFSSDLFQLQAVRSFVQRVCQQTPRNSEKFSLQLQLVINEIFCNIVKHSYHNQPKGEIIIESQLVEDGIYFTISDKGDSFNPEETKYPNFTGNQEDGFGFFIIQQITEQISYTPKNQENSWNHLQIFKRYFSEEDQMEFSHHIRDHVLIVTLKGESLDAKNASTFKESALSLIRTSGFSYLVFDLRQLQFIDSSGLGTLLSIQRTLNSQGGILKLSNLNKSIRTMFEIVSMHRIFDIFESTEEAVLSF